LVLSKLLRLFWSSAVRISFPDGSLSVIWGKILDERSWIMIPICWMLVWYHAGFFQTTAGVCSDQAVWSFELFEFFWLIRQILFTSVPLYYFDLKSDWLPFLAFAFGSPPEELLFWDGKSTRLNASHSQK
jgi:hypothetical protein